MGNGKLNYSTLFEEWYKDSESQREVSFRKKEPEHGGCTKSRIRFSESSVNATSNVGSGKELIGADWSS